MMELVDMVDSKSAGRWAVWVRLPLRVQGRLGALTGSAVRSRAGLKCGERAPLGVAVAKSPTSVSEGVLWGRAARVVSCVWLVSPFCGGRASGCGWCDNLILARAGAFPMVRGCVVVLAKIANALCENALCGWCLGMELN